MKATTDRLKTMPKIYKICNNIFKLCKEMLFCSIIETQHFPDSKILYTTQLRYFEKTNINMTINIFIMICVLHLETGKCVNMHLLESRTGKLISEIVENLKKCRTIVYPGWKE